MPSAEVVADVAADRKARSLRHVAAGNDVVLDFGLWFRRQRDEFRELLAPQPVEERLAGVEVCRHGRVLRDPGC